MQPMRSRDNAVVPSASDSSCRFLLARRLRFRVAAKSGGMLDLGVDFAAHQEGKAGDIQPHQQDHGGAERSISFAVAVEEVQIESKAKRCCNPQLDSNQRSWRDPVPVLL